MSLRLLQGPFPVSRAAWLTVALACGGLIGLALYFQSRDGLDPCPLCIFQRVAYLAAAAVALVAAGHGPGRRAARVYASLLGVASLAGAGIAGRQVWLQHLPADRVPECGPGLEFMLEMYAPFDVVKRVLRGTGDCAKVDWTLLGFSMAEWSLACFIGLLLVCVLQFLATRHREWV